MYTKIIDPSIVIYNGYTNEFIGSAKFNLTPESQDALLRLVNYNSIPASLLLMNLNFYQQSTYFDPPVLDQTVPRKGILRVIVVNDAGEQIPMEIRLRYDARARSNVSGSLTFFESAEYNNIEVDSIEEIFY
jgi:hypothetical protein